MWQFQIEFCSGAMSVLNSEMVRYSTAPIVNGSRVVHYRVGAADQSGFKTVVPIDVYIYIINVNDPPILLEEGVFEFLIPENSPPGTAFNISQPPYYDEDEDILTFYDATEFIPLEGLDEEYVDGKRYFSMNADSTLRVSTLGASVLNYEDPTASFAVTLTGSDGNGGFDTKTYVVVRVL